MTRRANDKIPKAKTKKSAQSQLIFDEGKVLLTEEQQYDLTLTINQIRQQVDEWRTRPKPATWGVTPETARLLQHWRTYNFSGARPFFCRIEAIETAIWLTEVAPHEGARG